MGIKFDGTYVKNGSKVVANMKRTDELKDGTSSGGKTLGNIKRRDEIGADFLPYVSQVPRTEVPYHSFAFGSVVANPLYWVVGKSIFEALEEDPFLKKVESYFKAMKEYSKR